MQLKETEMIAHQNSKSRHQSAKQHFLVITRLAQTFATSKK